MRNFIQDKIKPEYICTMGPSILSFDKLLELYNLGLRTVRFNMSHIDYDIDAVLKMIHEVEEITKGKIETMLDTCGSEARIEVNASKDIIKGDELIYKKDFNIDVPCQTIFEIGDIIQIDDGKINMEVISVNPIILKASNDGKLKNGTGIYTEKLSESLPFMSEKDKETFDLAFSKNLGWVACSFVKTKHDIEEVKKIKEKYPHCKTRIMAKIETRGAVENIDEIISVSDGIMIARGDLAVHYPIYQIAILEDYIADKVIKSSLPLVIGTGFLRTMKKSPIPERAEIVDLYHAFHFTNKIMFSGETAISDNPAHVLRTANNVFNGVNGYIKNN